MSAVNCPRCGKLFVKDATSASICFKCVKEEEDIFHSVRDFVKDNQNATLKDVAEATKVSTKKILQYVRDGRLELSSGMAGDNRCVECDKPITSGRYCERCQLELGFKINEMKPRSGGGKMHHR